MNLVAPFGFFGAGNIGDESTLQGFAKLIAASGNGFKVWVASRNPSHTAMVEPSFSYYRSRGRDLRRPWARLRSEADVVVGGTPIMDCLGKWPLNELAPLIGAARDRARQIVFVGSGVEGLHGDQSRRVLAETFAPVVLHWTVRSERDKERLLEYGVVEDRVTVAADLAWLLDAAGPDFGYELLARLGVNPDDYSVGVNLTNERFVIEREPRLFEKIAEFLDALIEVRGARILFFCNEVREGDSFDKAAARKAIACMKHRDMTFVIPNDYRTPQQTLSLIDCCDLTISMRYHFCIFSALQNVPFVALKRSDKVDDLCWDIDWPYGATLSHLNPGELLQLCASIDGNRTLVTDRLQQQVRSMRARALKNWVALDAIRDKLLPASQRE